MISIGPSRELREATHILTPLNASNVTPLVFVHLQNHIFKPNLLPPLQCAGGMKASTLLRQHVPAPVKPWFNTSCLFVRLVPKHLPHTYQPTGLYVTLAYLRYTTSYYVSIIFQCTRQRLQAENFHS